MAKIYPEDERYFNPESYAERRLYPLLAALPDDYTVYGNRRWHARGSRDRRPRPAEADFIVAHPERGILVVEVKGGLIRYEPGSDQWFSNDNPLKRSPFAQVERTRFLLVEMLEQTGQRGIAFPSAEAVAFPDTRVRSSDLPDGLLPERVIDADDLEAVERAIERAFEAFRLRGAERFGRRGVKVLTDAVAGSITVPRHLGRDLADAEAELIRLTENQYEVLESLEGNLRVCVLGGAGTGKTLLAMEQARRLAAQGDRVLMTCFNAPLAGHLRRELGNVDGVSVFNFHRLCISWAEEAGLDATRRDGEDEHSYYERRLPSLLSDAASALERDFDAILVDEAQDFSPDWLDALQLLLRDEEEDLFFLFADENQAIYRGGFEPPEGFLRYRLTGNLRNTAAVHGVLARHFGEQSRAKGPEGLPITVRCCRDDRALAQELSSLLTSFSANGIEPSRVTVLTGHSVQSSALARYADEPLGSFRLRPTPSRANDVRFESVHRFKGLEAPVVVLCEMEDLHAPARRSVWYTGLSRAQIGLVVLLRDEDDTLQGCDIDSALEAVLADD
jgi:hypothetical protein